MKLLHDFIIFSLLATVMGASKGLIETFRSRNDIKGAVWEKDFKKVSSIIERKQCGFLLKDEMELLRFLAVSAGDSVRDPNGDIYEILTVSCSNETAFMLGAVSGALLHDDSAVLEFILGIVQFSVDDGEMRNLSGRILSRCVKARNRRCVEILLDWEIPLECSGRNLMHLAAEVDDVELVKLAPVNRLFLDRRDSQNLYPLEDVYTKEMALAMNDRWDLESSLAEPSWSCTKQMYALTRQYQIPDKTLHYRLNRISRCMQDSTSHMLPNRMNIVVRRDHVVEDTIMAAEGNPNVWYSPNLAVRAEFEGEMGLDYGGPRLEWLTLLIDSFFKDPSPTDDVYEYTAPLFHSIDDESGMYAPNNLYPPHVYKFAGSIVALALKDQISLKVKLISAVVKCALVGTFEFTLREFIAQHPAHYKTLMKLKELDADTFENLDLHYESNAKAKVAYKDLNEYVYDVARFRLFGIYEPALRAFSEGFHSIARYARLYNYFTHEEIGNILRGGSGAFSVKEFLAHCTITANLPGSLAMFTEMLETLNTNERLALVRFMTGRNSIPFEGISSLPQKFEICFDALPETSFPTAATCFSRLSMPRGIQNAAEMKKKLLYSIEHSKDTFSLS
jgi:hypothetical protein